MHRRVKMAPWPTPGGLGFAVYIDGVRVAVYVSAEILQERFGAPNPGDATLARAFYVHAEELQNEAVRQYLLNPSTSLTLLIPGPDLA